MIRSEEIIYVSCKTVVYKTQRRFRTAIFPTKIANGNLTYRTKTDSVCITIFITKYHLFLTYDIPTTTIIIFVYYAIDMLDLFFKKVIEHVSTSNPFAYTP